MNFLEKDIEDFLFTNFNNEKSLNRRGFYSFEKKYYRQFNFGAYGICDIVGFSIDKNKKELSVTIYELKRESIGVDTFLQSLKYLKGVQKYLSETGYDSMFSNIKLKLVLVGSSIDTNSNFIYMPDIFDNVSFYTYSFNLNHGILFERHISYSLVEEFILEKNFSFSEIKESIKEQEDLSKLPF